MFSIEVVESDAFCSLPASAQTLYLHLSMNVDDDGFVDKWKSILRYLKIKRTSLDCLINTGYVIELDGDVLLIADWLRNNSIRRDKYSPSAYFHLLDTLDVHPNGRYFKASEVFWAPQNRVE